MYMHNSNFAVSSQLLNVEFEKSSYKGRRRLTMAAVRLCANKGVALKAYLYLCEWKTAKFKRCFAADATIAKALGCTEPTWRKVRKRLERAGLITVHPFAGSNQHTGLHRTCEITVNQLPGDYGMVPSWYLNRADWDGLSVPARMLAYAIACAEGRFTLTSRTAPELGKMVGISRRAAYRVWAELIREGCLIFHSPDEREMNGWLERHKQRLYAYSLAEKPNPENAPKAKAFLEKLVHQRIKNCAPADQELCPSGARIIEHENKAKGCSRAAHNPSIESSSKRCSTPKVAITNKVEITKESAFNPAPGHRAEPAVSIAQSRDGKIIRLPRNQRHRRKTTKTTTIDSIELTDAMRAYAVDHQLHPERQFERFRNFNLSRATYSADWEATWRQWVGKAPPDQKIRPALPLLIAPPSVRAAMERADAARIDRYRASLAKGVPEQERSTDNSIPSISNSARVSSTKPDRQVEPAFTEETPKQHSTPELDHREEAAVLSLQSRAEGFGKRITTRKPECWECGAPEDHNYYTCPERMKEQSVSINNYDEDHLHQDAIDSDSHSAEDTDYYPCCRNGWCGNHVPQP